MKMLSNSYALLKYSLFSLWMIFGLLITPSITYGQGVTFEITNIGAATKRIKAIDATTGQTLASRISYGGFTPIGNYNAGLKTFSFNWRNSFNKNKVAVFTTIPNKGYRGEGLLVTRGGSDNFMPRIKFNSVLSLFSIVYRNSLNDYRAEVFKINPNASGSQIWTLIALKGGGTSFMPRIKFSNTLQLFSIVWPNHWNLNKVAVFTSTTGSQQNMLAIRAGGNAFVPQVCFFSQGFGLVWPSPSNGRKRAQFTLSGGVVATETCNTTCGCGPVASPVTDIENNVTGKAGPTSNANISAIQKYPNAINLEHQIPTGSEVSPELLNGVDLNITGIDNRDVELTHDLALSKLTVFPNPAQIGSNLTLEFQLSNPSEHSVLTIYDMVGKKIQEQKVSLEKGANTINIATDKLSKGMFYIILQNGDDLIKHKVMVQ